MVLWVVVMVVMAFASFMQDLLSYYGRIPPPNTVFWAIVWNVLLLLVALGILYRMAMSQKVGEKEALIQKVEELEAKLKEKES